MISLKPKKKRNGSHSPNLKIRKYSACTTYDNLFNAHWAGKGFLDLGTARLAGRRCAEKMPLLPSPGVEKERNVGH